MIYKIDCQFYDCLVTYYASSFGQAYSLFKKMGAKLIRTNILITGKMYEKKEGDIRKSVYYTLSSIVAKSPEITMGPYSGTEEVNILTASEALDNLHWKIFSKEVEKCVPGLNDLRFHYGK